MMAKIKKRDAKIAATKRRAEDADEPGSYNFASSDDEEHMDDYINTDTGCPSEEKQTFNR